MDTFEKIKKSWWVIFPFTLFLPGLGFIYIGLKSSNRNWTIEGITYQLPFFFYLLASAIYSSEIMINYYGWIMLLAALIALIRSIMVAIKLMDVYEKDDRPKIAASNYTSPSSGSPTAPKKDRDFGWSECCGCIILIFIIFAIISIL